MPDFHVTSKVFGSFRFERSRVTSDEQPRNMSCTLVTFEASRGVRSREVSEEQFSNILAKLVT